MKKNYFQNKVRLKYLKSVFQSKIALNSLFFQLAEVEEGESGEENNLFDKAIQFVQDPKLKKMIKVHQEDEKRHGRELTKWIDGQIYSDLNFREDLNYLKLLENSEFKSISDIKSDKDLLTFFTTLKILEERAVENYLYYIRAAEGNIKLVRFFEQIVRDEKKHLRFCETVISSIHNISELEKEKMYQEYKHIESDIFSQLTITMIQFHVDAKIFKGDFESFFWQTLRYVMNRFSLKVPA